MSGENVNVETNTEEKNTNTKGGEQERTKKEEQEKMKKEYEEKRKKNDRYSKLFNTNPNNNELIVTYKDVENAYTINFMSVNINNSNIIDIIGIYIKGQKILYTEAKTTCEQRLSYLILPSILFTILSSIINLLIDNVTGKIITTALNGIITFILALINYLKLDARAEAHRSSAYKYDKLLTLIEFQSCKQLFLQEAKIEMNKKIEEIENAIKEIKETNQFVLPEIIRYNFPFLSSINIFSEVKKILNKEMLLKNKLAGVLSDIQILEKKLNGTDIEKGDKKNELEIELQLKIIEKDNLIELVLRIQDEYISLDEEFKTEMKNYSNRNKYCLRIFDWLKV